MEVSLSLWGLITEEREAGRSKRQNMASRSFLSKLPRAYCSQLQRRRFSGKPSSPSSPFSAYTGNSTNVGTDDEAVPTAGISKPLSDILKDLNKKVPESLISHWTEASGNSIRYIPWHVLNRILNLHAPEWSGEVRNIIYSADGKSVSIVYRVTLYGTDAEIYREATGTALVSNTNYGDAVQKAEAMAFRRACARLGLGLYLYHEDLE